MFVETARSRELGAGSVWCMLCTLERRLLGPGLGLCLLIGLLMGQLLQLLRQSCPWHWGHYYEDKGVVYLPVCLLLQLWQILQINWHFYQNKTRVPYLDISTKETTTAQKKCNLQKGWALDWNPLYPVGFANFSLRTWQYEIPSAIRCFIKISLSTGRNSMLDAVDNVKSRVIHTLRHETSCETCASLWHNHFCRRCKKQERICWIQLLWEVERRRNVREGAKPQVDIRPNGKFSLVQAGGGHRLFRKLCRCRSQHPKPVPVQIGRTGDLPALWTSGFN